MIAVVCGPPATGKTTLATGLRDRLAERGYGFEILHSDDFTRRTYERMFGRVAGSDANWILDGTFYEREWQEQFRTLGNVRIAWVDAGVETAVARNRERGDPISERGLYAMHAKFEPPREDLRIETDDCGVPEALDRLEAAAVRWIEGTER